MNYKEKYEKAIVHLKKFLVGDCVIDQDILDDFPELRESEDERIRKALVSMVKWFGFDSSFFTSNSVTKSKVLAYLERQKEQKPIEFKNDELVEIIKGEFEGFRRLLKKKGIDYEPQYGYWEGFARLFDSSAREYVKEQKPAEWSEEDEKNFSSLCEFFTTWSKKHYTAYGRQEAMEKWLFNRFKYLNPQPKVELSEEDMETLNCARYWLNNMLEENKAYDISELGCELSVNGVIKHLDTILSRLTPPHRKPSEEQMNTIGLAIQVLNSSGHNSLCCKLNALRDDLLKQK